MSKPEPGPPLSIRALYLPPENRPVGQKKNISEKKCKRSQVYRALPGNWAEDKEPLTHLAHTSKHTRPGSERLKNSAAFWGRTKLRLLCFASFHYSCLHGAPAVFAPFFQIKSNILWPFLGFMIEIDLFFLNCHCKSTRTSANCWKCKTEMILCHGRW